MLSVDLFIAYITRTYNRFLHISHKKKIYTPKVVVKAVTPVTPVDETTKISAAKQNTFTEFTVTMSKALETVAAADFSMVRDDDNQVITVKSATLDATDKTQVKLVVYTSLTDAKTYTITYTATDEAKTQSSTQVTVTDGTVADVAITPLEITANKETVIDYQTLDANGVIVSEKKVCDPETKVEVSCNTLLGTLDNATSKLILYNVGDTATFTVTYHTYKYDSTTGAEQNVIKKDFTVTAVKDASIVSQYNYTVATTKPYDWSKVTPVSTVALGDGEDSTADRYAFFQIKNQKGDDITADCGYTVESSDNSKVVADGTVADGVLLKPVSTGSAYLMIKDMDGKVVSTLPITVGEKRKLSVFKLSTNAVTIATDAAVNTVATGYAEVTAKDQYGEDIAVTLDKKVRTDNVGVTVDETYASGKTIQISSNGASANKTGVYTIIANDTRNNTMTTTLNVTTKAPTGTDTYSVVFLDGNSKVLSSVDTTVKEAAGDASATAAAITSVIVKRNNGVVVNKLADSSVSCSAIKVTRNGDNKVFFDAKAGATATVTSAAIATDTADNYTGDNKDADELSIDITSLTGTSAIANPLVKNLTAGNYTVRYTITVGGKVYNPYATLAVTDKQTAVTANILSTTAGDYNFKSIIANTDFVKFYYGDVQLKTAEYQYVKADYTINSNGKNAYVKTVTLNVKAASSNNYFQVTVPVNKTFTNNNTWTSADFDV